MRTRAKYINIKLIKQCLLFPNVCTLFIGYAINLENILNYSNDKKISKYRSRVRIIGLTSYHASRCRKVVSFLRILEAIRNLRIRFWVKFRYKNKYFKTMIVGKKLFSRTYTFHGYLGIFWLSLGKPRKLRFLPNMSQFENIWTSNFIFLALSK